MQILVDGVPTDRNEVFIAVAASLLLEAVGGVNVDEKECHHRIKVGVNDNLAVCLVCKARISGPAKYGIAIDVRDHSEIKNSMAADIARQIERGSDGPEWEFKTI